MKLSQLSLADYNQLDSIPVINQDLSATDFTPVANTYYRHTGATTDTFTQGIIYLYDTAYHKLGESGGTTLNRYTYSVDLTNLTVSILERLLKILSTAKGNVTIGNALSGSPVYTPNYISYTNGYYALTLYRNQVSPSENKVYQHYYNVNTSDTTDKTKSLSRTYYIYTLNSDGTIVFSNRSSQSSVEDVRVVYYNDTEIK